MIAALAYSVCALALVSMGWGLVTAVLDKPPGKAQLLYAAGLEVVVLVQSVIALVRLGAGFRPVELATTIGYWSGSWCCCRSPGYGPTASAPASPASCSRWPPRPSPP